MRKWDKNVSNLSNYKDLEAVKLEERETLKHY